MTSAGGTVIIAITTLSVSRAAVNPQRCGAGNDFPVESSRWPATVKDNLVDSARYRVVAQIVVPEGLYRISDTPFASARFQLYPRGKAPTATVFR